MSNRICAEQQSGLFDGRKRVKGKRARLVSAAGKAHSALSKREKTSKEEEELEKESAGFRPPAHPRHEPEGLTREEAALIMQAKVI